MPETLPAESSRVRSRTFATLLDHPDYRRYFLGQGVSLIGTWLQSAAVSWIVFEMTRSAWWLGAVEFAAVMPGLLVGLIAGALADRVAPKSMILAMQVGQMLLTFLLAALIGLGIAQIWQMALILALTRVCVTFEMPSRQVFLFELVGRSSLMNAIALNSGLFNASRVVGPALAGICLSEFGRTAPFLLNGASYLAAIGALLTIRVGSAPKLGQGKGLAGILGGFAYLGRDRRVAVLYGLMTFFGVVGMGYSAMIPAYARLVVRTREAGYSVLLSSGGVGATAGALVVASLGGLRRKERLVAGGMLLFAGSLGAAGLLPGLARDAWSSRAVLPVSASCLFGVGFGAIIFFSATQTLIQVAVPDHLRGRIMGVWMIVYSGSVSLGALATGELASRRGVTTVMEISAILCAFAALAILVSGVLTGAKTLNDGHGWDGEV